MVARQGNTLLAISRHPFRRNAAADGERSEAAIAAADQSQARQPPRYIVALRGSRAATIGRFGVAQLVCDVGDANIRVLQKPGRGAIPGLLEQPGITQTLPPEPALKSPYTYTRNLCHLLDQERLMSEMTCNHPAQRLEEVFRRRGMLQADLRNGGFPGGQNGDKS